MKLFLAVLVAAIALAKADIDDDLLAVVQRRIPNNSWTAKKVSLAERERRYKQLGWIKKETETSFRPGLDLEDIKNNYVAPESFDARTKWSNCSSISKIWDQAACGSCWAFSAATVMSDRICIHKEKNFLVSPEDILSCCTYNYFDYQEQCGDCLNGGYIEYALDYFVQNGVCSGGEYGEKNTCKPYSIDPSQPVLQPTPQCTDSCTDKAYSIAYKDDLVKGSKGSYRVPPNEDAIKEEIEKNGPVAGGFIVYEDFSMYQSGVYQHSWGQQRGGHAIRIIGWGTENNTPYWLVANSWSETWGEEGTFKILRGSDHCGIESNISAALP